MKFICLLALLVLAGCSTMDLDKCQTTNWEEKGQEDAFRNHNNYFASYSNQCQQFGVTPNQTLYQIGFAKGLDQLCTFQNGYLIGNEGSILPRICPKETQEKFVQGFVQGQANHDHKEQMEKQNELLQKAIELNKPARACDSNWQCDINQYCSQGICR